MEADQVHGSFCNAVRLGGYGFAEVELTTKVRFCCQEEEYG